MFQGIPDPPWLYLIDFMNRGWREKQILKGRNPDPYMEQKLVEAGIWPPKNEEPIASGAPGT